MNNPISLELSKSIEFFEEKAWLNMYQVAPASFAEAMGLSYETFPEGNLLFCQKIPFAHFNSTATFGLHNIVDEKSLKRLIEIYRAKHAPKIYVHLTPHHQPPQLKDWLLVQGFKKASHWERIYRDAQTLAKPLSNARNFQIKEVNRENVEKWADFIDKIYGLPTQPWLLNLVNREGWHHFILEENEQIAAVRTVFIQGDFAWSGIDAPVPGIMTQDYDLDYQLFYALVKKGLMMGVKHFLADIELPNDAMNLPSYHNFKQLGFQIPYRRDNYVLNLNY